MPDRLSALMLTAVLTSPLTLHGQDAPECRSSPALLGVSTHPARHDRTTRDGTPAAYMGDQVILKVCGLKQLTDSARTHQQDVVLFMNGLEAGAWPSAINDDGQTLTFTLNRVQERPEVWERVLHAPLFSPTETIRMGVGLRGGRPIPLLPHGKADLVFLKVRIDWTTWSALVFVLASFIAVVWFGWNSDMLREGPASGRIRQPYSLARVQMAGWFVLLVTGYVAIWLVDGDLDTLTPSLLALAGISAVTGLAAVALTPRSVVRTDALRTRLTEELAASDHTIAELSTDLGSLGDRPEAAVARKLLEKRQAARDHLAIELATAPAVFASRGFWTDLVGDDRGVVALDRMQIVVWTLVLMGIFIHDLVYELRMPEFSATLLGLMGISSGTYLGFKLPAATGTNVTR